MNEIRLCLIETSLISHGWSDRALTFELLTQPVGVDLVHHFQQQQGQLFALRLAAGELDLASHTVSIGASLFFIRALVGLDLGCEGGLELTFSVELIATETCLDLGTLLLRIPTPQLLQFSRTVLGMLFLECLRLRFERDRILPYLRIIIHIFPAADGEITPVLFQIRHFFDDFGLLTLEGQIEARRLLLLQPG